jgi:predicted AAA+ superfamily ATPase
MGKLIELYKRLLILTDSKFVRYLHDGIDWNVRLIGITGARETGKTTLLLQHIKYHLDTDKTVYVSVDEIYFSENRLFGFAEMFYKQGGKNKEQKQISSISDAFIVKDDIEFEYQNVLPLWTFGFNY